LLSTNFGKIISEDDFWKVQGLIHLANNEDPEAKTEKLHKESKFHLAMEYKWNLFYSRGLNLTLDECMIPFSGRLSFFFTVHKRKTNQVGDQSLPSFFFKNWLLL